MHPVRYALAHILIALALIAFFAAHSDADVRRNRNGISAAVRYNSYAAPRQNYFAARRNYVAARPNFGAIPRDNIIRRTLAAYSGPLPCTRYPAYRGLGRVYAYGYSQVVVSPDYIVYSAPVVAPDANAGYALAPQPTYRGVPSPAVDPADSAEPGAFAGGPVPQGTVRPSYYLFQNRHAASADRSGEQASEKPKDPALAQAITDIEMAYRTGDTTSLARHIDLQAPLTLQVEDKSRKPLDPGEYLDMTTDALKALHTVRYNLDHFAPASNGAMMVYGTHVYQNEVGTEMKFNVGFILQKRGNNWMVSQISADPAK